MWAMKRRTVVMPGLTVSPRRIFAIVVTGTPVNPNAIVFEFFYLLTATAYTVAILSFAYKALKGFDVDNAIGDQSTEDDPSLHMPMGAL